MSGSPGDPVCRVNGINKLGTPHTKNLSEAKVGAADLRS